MEREFFKWEYGWAMYKIFRNFAPYWSAGSIIIMNLWALLMAICFFTAIYSGWVAGEPAGNAGIVIGLLTSLLLGVLGVVSMIFTEMRISRWLETKQGAVQIIAYLLMHILGLLWCLPVAMAVVFLTRFLIHNFLTHH